MPRTDIRLVMRASYHEDATICIMRYGTLDFETASVAPDLLAGPVQKFLTIHPEIEDVWVSKIDPSLADTAAFCEKYEVELDVSANCIVVEAKRGERIWYAACIILATTKADINGAVRRLLDARKISFAPMDKATALTAMEYGGITPIGLPADWPILIDEQVVKQDKLIIGSGIRSSKILTTPGVLSSLPNVEIQQIIK
jgi:prolyl-tRNA editing enzyme YbaK/EbsC (Cys-tRNA(Pro) deacylase)